MKGEEGGAHRVASLARFFDETHCTRVVDSRIKTKLVQEHDSSCLGSVRERRVRGERPSSKLMNSLSIEGSHLGRNV